MKASLGDVGLEINLPLGEDADGETLDLSGASLTIEATAPSGARSTWNATSASLADGTSVVRYTTQADDLDEAGVWRLRARAVGSGFDLRSPTIQDLEIIR